MKGKYLLGGVFTALLGAAIALFAYTKLVDRPSVIVEKDSSGITTPGAQTYLTSMEMQESPIDFTYAAEQTVHAVVHVHTKTVMGNQPENPIMQFFYGDRENSKPRVANGYGSGVIISSDGYIVTNNHVIEDAQTVEVTLNDKRSFTAKIVGRDPDSDIALLKIDAKDLPYIKFGDSDNLKIGQWVLAVGNPFNLTSTVTAGIVSALGRSLGLNEGTYHIESFIQTDAALNPGNSGGALVNTQGLLVGITSAIISPNGAYAGNSFAIPVSIVKKVVDDLKQYGHVQRALIGVNIQDVDQKTADKLDLKSVNGVLVSGVTDDGAAKAAGLKENDVIVKFNGVPTNTVSELQVQVGKCSPGDKASVTYIRGGKENTVQLTLKNQAGTTGVVTAAMTDNTVFGASLVPLSPDEMESLNVNYGVKVTDLKDGKFKAIGMSPGYIILTINGKKVRSASDVRNYTDNEKSLKSIGGIQPDGSILNYQFGN
ncbi:MAG TPA: Do family serine endopeptidase [Bacteroidales bacterium]|nr:Do family serine endopeptidase [Bacteroidales bacterium]